MFTGCGKLIRAVLTAEGVHAGIGHQLDRMVESVPDENPVKQMLRDIQGLGIYATAYRYPTTVGRIKPAPGYDEFKRFADKVGTALQEVIKHFDVDIDSTAPAGNADPIRGLNRRLSRISINWSARASAAAQFSR